MNKNISLFIAIYVIVSTSIYAQNRSGLIVHESENLTKAKQSLSNSNIIEAIGLDESDVVSINFGNSDLAGYGIYSESAAEFPREGNDYLILSTGGTDYVIGENTAGNTSGELNGLNSPAGNDMVQMIIELNVPQNANAIEFTWKFFTEEYQEFVGSDFNDAFLVEYGESTFSISGNQIIAPKNKAKDCAGELITVNTTGDNTCIDDNEPTMKSGFAEGTIFDGATERLKTSIPIIPGESTVKLIFSIFDVGDDIYDTAVFLDEFGFSTYDPNQELELLALEVNQSIQDWNDSIALIEGKRTFVRAHLQKGQSDNPTARNIRLRVWDNSNNVGTLLTAINSNLYQIPKNFQTNDELRIRRRNMNSTLNFILDSGEWLSGDGDVEIQLVDIGQGSIDCSNTYATTDNNCAKFLTFQPVAIPKIKYIIIEKEFADGSINSSEAKTYAKSTKELMINMLPVRTIEFLPEETLKIRYNNKNEKKSANFILNKLNDKWQQDLLGGNITDDVIYYGFIYGGVKNFPFLNKTILGASEVSGNVGFTNVFPAFFLSKLATTTHEVGHILNLKHAVNNFGFGFCGERDLPGFSSFPYSIVNGGEEIASIGPYNLGPNKEIYGVYFKHREVLSSIYSSESDFDNQEFKFPNPALMSYCEETRWVSMESYNILIDEINTRFSSDNGLQKLAGIQQIAPSEYLVVKGDIDLTSSEVEFRSFSTIESTPELVNKILPEKGQYILEVYSNDNLLSSIEFAPKISISQEISNFGKFSIPVLNENIDKVRVLYGNNVIGSKQISSNIPTVNILSHTENVNITTNTELIWEANDADNDSLEFAVQFSFDTGQTWKTLTTGWTEKSINIDLEQLSKTTQGLFRVQVTDGFSSSEDITSGILSIPNLSPNSEIYFPSDSITAVGFETINFTGVGTDKEDGQIPGTSLKWYSSLDGEIGSGTSFLVEALGLSEGEHQISLDVTDSEGASSFSNPITIFIYHTPPATTTPVYETPDKINLIEPQDGALDIATNTEVLWDDVSFAETYQFQLSTNQYFNDPVIDVENVSATNYPLSELNEGVVYFWRVRGNNKGEFGDWSDTWSFKTVIYTSDEDQKEIPKETELKQNYPNPFNPITNLNYSISETGNTKLVVYNVLGQEVATLINAIKSPGNYSLSFNASDLSSGIYIYQLKTPHKTITKRMMLIK